MKKDARDKIVTRIIETMAQVGSNWVKSWATIAHHKNAQNGRVYNGINAMLLALIAMVEEYETPLWVTWSQMKALGGHPKEDQWEKSHIVMWARPDSYVVKDNNGKIVLDSNGDPKERKYWRRGIHKVWNVSQTTLKESAYSKYLPEIREKATNQEIDTWIDSVVDGCGCADYTAELSNIACYSPITDRITVPAPGQYEEIGEYYSTLFHEIGHSTGHKMRLGRGLDNRKGSAGYAQEELVAELTSAILCSEFSVTGHVRHAQYLNHWLDHCKKDSTILTKAASQAKKAVEFLHNAAKKVEKKAA